MDKVSNITELPLDILVLIFPHLDAKSFLALCSTCKALQQPSIRLDPAYWSHATQSTFRVPNQPVVQHDGVRWQKMYRRLLTQSRVYTWGNNAHHRLGHTYEHEPVVRRPGAPRFRRLFHNNYCFFPKEMERTRDLGIVADLQCGGWSTTILTSNGTLYIVGVLDGQSILGTVPGQEHLQALRFPVGYPYSTAAAAYEEPTIAIRQFSAGRSHILGLSDSGRIWSWYDKQKSALHVKFANVDIKEGLSYESNSASTSLYGQVKQVVAGWSCSSAYIYGTGLVLWEPVHRGSNDEEADTMLVLENFEVPKTGYQRIKGATRETDQDKALGEEVGVVLNHIIMENFVVFVTDIGKVFCAKLGDKNKVDDILELRALRNEHGSEIDVQGSFRRCAIFKNGEVVIIEQTYLEGAWNSREQNPEQTSIAGLKKIPALQHNDVISIAFGDYHFLALHSNGKITSYGTELQSCGALGLGGDGDPEGRLRGIAYNGFGHDGKLLPHAYTHGRQVWFRKEQKEWLRHLMASGNDQEEAKERTRLFSTDRNIQGEVSEWVEQEGKEWDKDKGEDDLGAYFALRVSAAGWHSGALVLVNEELADKEPTYDWRSKTFPRLKLSDGREMPGTVEFDEWREGRPEWQLNVEV